jgi:hypothetical protein
LGNERGIYVLGYSKLFWASLKSFFIRHVWEERYMYLNISEDNYSGWKINIDSTCTCISETGSYTRLKRCLLKIIIVSPLNDSSTIVWHISNGTFEEVDKYCLVEEKHWLGIQNFVSILINKFELTISNAKLS